MGLKTFLSAAHRPVIAGSPKKQSRLLVAVAVSLVLHTAILVLILVKPGYDGHGDNNGFSVGGHSRGQDVADFQVSIVNLSASQNSIAKVNDAAIKAPLTDAPIAPQPPLDNATLTPPQSQPDEKSSPSKSQDMATLQGAKAETGGRGDNDLRAQIQRCLPPGVRPALSKAMLTLQLDKTGTLSSVPHLEMDINTASKVEIKEANQVIQATLQCGPYVVSGDKDGNYTLVADFSNLTDARAMR